MRGNAICLLASAFIALSVSGCNAFGKKDTAAERSFTGIDSYTASAQEAAYESDQYPTYGPAEPVEVSSQPPTSTTESEPRFHTVAKRDTLYALARMYYGDQRRWKDIYEANRSVIGDPNMIRIGQRLLIP